VELPIAEKCGGKYSPDRSDSGEQLGSKLETRSSHCALSYIPETQVARGKPIR